MKKIKEFTFFEEQYETHISYLFGGEVEDLILFIRSRHKDEPKYSWSEKFEWGDDANTTDAYQFHVNAPLGKGERFYVWIYELSANRLYHETFHLAGDILHTRGSRYSYDSEENYAYLGSWIFQKIFTMLGGKLKVPSK